jgi:hypothetical protein
VQFEALSASIATLIYLNFTHSFALPELVNFPFVKAFVGSSSNLFLSFPARL